MRYELTRQLIGDEDKRKCVYKDHLGYYTIGIGRLVDDRKPGAGLRDSEMEFMLRNDIDDRIEALGKRLPWFQNLDDARRGVLLNMSFQLGVEGLLEFKRTLALVEAGKYEEAARNMLVSLWAQQTPERAKRMSEQMKTGKWQYAPGT
jgi:lysozyme